MTKTKFTLAILIVFLCKISTAQKIGDTLTLSNQLIKEGILAYDTSNYEAASKLYSQVSPSDTNYNLAHYELTMSLSSEKKYAEAISNAKKGIKRNDENLRDFYWLIAQTYDNYKKPDSAHFYYNECKKLFPHAGKTYYEEAITYMGEKKWEEAIKQLETSFKLNLFNKRTHIIYADMAYTSGQPALALMAMHFSSLINTTPKAQYDTYKLMVSMSDDNYNSEKPSPENTLKNLESLEEINQLVKAKIALTPKYKIKTRLDEPYIRQLHMILERLDNIPSKEENYMANFYCTFYKELWNQGYFEGAIMSGLSALKEIESVNKAFNKNKGVVDDFVAWANKDLIEKRRQYKIESMGTNEDLTFAFHDNGELAAYGNQKADKTIFGDWVYFRNNGIKSAEGKYNDQGKEEGTWKYYYNNGLLSKVEEYEAELDKVHYTSYYENGYKKEDGTKVNKQYVDNYYEYHPTGALKMELTIKDGKASGIIKGYSSEGALEYEREVVDPGKSGNYTSYFANGQKSAEGHLLNGDLSGAYKSYYPTGELKEEMNFEGGYKTGEYKKYFRNGKTQSIASFKNGKYDGSVKEYSNQGILKNEYEYKNGKANGPSNWYDANDGKVYAHLTFKNERLNYYEFLDKNGNIIYKEEEKSGEILWKNFTPYGLLTEKSIYKKGEFNDEFISYYPDGSIQRKFNYKDGKIDGEATYYYRNGTVSDELMYSEGNRTGFCKSYFQDGTIKLKGYYMNGESNGPMISYHENGKIDSDEFYEEDVLTGIDLSYYPNGKRNVSLIYKDKEPFKMIIFDENDLSKDTISFDKPEFYCKEKGDTPYNQWEGAYKYGVKTGPWKVNYGQNMPSKTSNYLCGKQHGYFKLFYANGNIRQEGKYVLGKLDSILTSYDEFGVLSSRENYDNGESEGEEIFYYSSGKIMTTYSNRNDELDGICKTFAEVGSLMLERNFFEGELVSYSYEDNTGKKITIPIVNGNAEVKTYYKDGKPAISFVMKNGKRDGEYSAYYPSGKLYYTNTYKNGSFNGPSKEYYPSGQLKEEAEYSYGDKVGTLKIYNPNGQLYLEETYEDGYLHGPASYYSTAGKLLKKVQFYYGYEYIP